MAHRARSVPLVVGFAVLGLAVIGLAPRNAPAHFALRAPTAWRVQDGLGNPQKDSPCGDGARSPGRAS